MKPSWSALNFMPSSTGNVSPPSTVVGVVKSNKVDCGVTESDAADCAPLPIAFVACTLNVYAAPLVNPVMVALVADADTVTGVCAVDPMYGVIVWLVIGLSPSVLGRVQTTCAWLVAGRALTPVGGGGTTGF